MINTRELTEGSLEKNFVTNTLATHMLTTGLIPLLKRYSKNRIFFIRINRGTERIVKNQSHIH